MPPVSRAAPRRDAGFTFVELMVVLLVTTVLMLFTIPPLLEYLFRAELEQTGTQVQMLLRKARQKSISRQAPSFAVRQGRNVLAFVDLDGDSSYSDGTDEELGRVALPAKVEWVSDFTAGFQANGSATGLGDFQFKNRRGDQLKVSVTSLASGNVHVEKLY
jgi:prepilin-type N-terminal cleavage/methylation domain-containing protein